MPELLVPQHNVASAATAMCYCTPICAGAHVACKQSSDGILEWCCFLCFVPPAALFIFPNDCDYVVAHVVAHTYSTYCDPSRTCSKSIELEVVPNSSVL